MAYTLDALIEDCRNTLQEGESEKTLTLVCDHVKRALADPSFLESMILNRPAEPERVVLYEDADLGFCVCAHVYEGEKSGAPHDHGPTWAIYGQAAGETEMTDWRILRPAADGNPAKVELIRRYTMVPGDAHIYPTGAVHAPLRNGPTRLLRIEGRNTDKITRTPIEAV
ncbi:MAG: hypothetical protein P1V34_15920 [Alphaproteobacteria bacterium]|nr:hypothetical protein [Alphaproteobacteria bacterium]